MRLPVPTLPTGRPRVLFVDDEPHLLAGLARSLRGRVEQVTTTEPAEALRLLAEDGPFEAVVSDLRMPAMDGVALLGQARLVAPDTTRMLLTGFADVSSVMSAVNHGAIFRVLCKPCPVPDLEAALDDAVRQHRLVTGERVLLQATLRGSVEALVETLSMAAPTAFARAVRLRRLTVAVARRLDLPDPWQVEIAAQLGELGVVTLPEATVEALRRGSVTGREEQRMLTRLPELADEVLSRIPRLEEVRTIIRCQQPVHADRVEGCPWDAPEAARVLQLVREYDALEARELTPAEALDAVRSRGHHDEEHLVALTAALDARGGGQRVREVDLSELVAGDVLAVDLCSRKGNVLVGRGHALGPALLARIRNYADTGGLDGRALVVDRRAEQED
jgi:response regulator RpfG family c-di-GMP phosphodiesterase